MECIRIVCLLYALKMMNVVSKLKAICPGNKEADLPLSCVPWESVRWQRWQAVVLRRFRGYLSMGNNEGNIAFCSLTSMCTLISNRM